MKKLLLILSLAFFVACGEGTLIDVPSEQIEPKSYTVSFGMVGEITVENAPLSKASPDDLYGIQVYSKTATGTDYYTACAYGLFDDKSKMTINLLEGYIYKFHATMVVDGKNIISFYDSGYSKPFTVQHQDIKLENKFIWSANEMDNGLRAGYSYIKEADGFGAYYRPFTDRYYGEIMDYTPIKNGNIDLNMKRVVFGVKFVADGLSEGKLIIQMSKSPKLMIESGSTEIEKLVTFEGNFGSAWITDGHSEEVPITITWEKADGVTVPFISQTVTFTRKQLSTITIKIRDAGVNSGMNITEEAGDLTAGDDHIFDGGDGIETPVKP